MPKKLTQEQFIEKTKQIHGNEYDYSKAEYINAKTKINIICSKHGEFTQTPDCHLQGQGCPKCKNEKIGEKNKFTQEQFIEKANNIHNFKYNYSQVIYNGYDYKVSIICPIHGKFEQQAGSHLRGTGCFKCGTLLQVSKRTLPQKEFIKRANIIHDNFYDYSETEYKHSKIKIKIICPIHGSFWQTPGHHLNGCGCPKCNSSKGEKQINKYLKNNNIQFLEQYRFKDCRNKKPLPFDFYLPEQNMCIEFDGIQHFIPNYPKNDILKSNNIFLRTKIHDQIKNQYCLNNNIKLLRISYLDQKNIITILNKEINQ